MHYSRGEFITQARTGKAAPRRPPANNPPGGIYPCKPAILPKHRHMPGLRDRPPDRSNGLFPRPDRRGPRSAGRGRVRHGLGSPLLSGGQAGSSPPRCEPWITLLAVPPARRTASRRDDNRDHLGAAASKTRERFERYGTIPIAMLPMPTTLVVRSKVGTL